MAKARIRRSKQVAWNITKRSFQIPLFFGIIWGYALGYFIFYNLPGVLNHEKDLLDSGIREDTNSIDSNQVGSYVNINETERKDTNKVRLLCWIMTHPENHATKAIHVKNTWGKRCDVLLFMSSESDSSLPTVKLPVWEGREYLWSKTRKAFKYVFKNYFDKADWFLKADDDTYVIVENLKYLLADQNSSEPVYFGWRMKHHAKQGFMSGGAGYVLSKISLVKFVSEALPNRKKCEGNYYEDITMGVCLENVGVKAINTRDSYGRERFFPIIPNLLLVEGSKLPDWYIKQAFYTPQQGRDCCSDAAISFHYVSPATMYMIEHLLYHIKPYGIYNEMTEIGNTTYT